MNSAECVIVIDRKSQVEPLDVACIVFQNLEKNVLLTRFVHSSTNFAVGKFQSFIFHGHRPHMVVHVQDFGESIYAENVLLTGEDCGCVRTVSAQSQSRKQVVVFIIVVVVIVIIIIFVVAALEKSLKEMLLGLCLTITWCELCHNVIRLPVLEKVEPDPESCRQSHGDDDEPPRMPSDESADPFQTRSDWFLYTVCGEHHGNHDDLIYSDHLG